MERSDMLIIFRTFGLAILLLLTACQTGPRPSDESAWLAARLPALFNDDSGSYVVLVKHDARAITAEHGLTFDGIGPILIAEREIIVWKVAPGIHRVSYGPRQGDKAMRFELFEGNRVILEVDGAGGFYVRSFASDRANLARNPDPVSYFDMSNEAPPEPPRPRR